MQVNFTGIKNMGYEYRHYRPSAYRGDGSIEAFEDNYDHFLTVQLTDDYNGKDLTNFRNAVKTSDLCNYIHPVNPSLLNISIEKTEFDNKFARKPEVDFFINDEVGENLEINEQNLKLFSFIGQLLKRISTLQDKDFVVNKDYIENDASTSILLGYGDLREAYGENYDSIMAQTHSPEVVRNGAAEMSEILTDKMIDYLT